ncbi:MAG: GNAT family N-acetyltransferase [Bacillota bacterium]
MIVLETERMVLRRMTPSDVDDLLLIFADPLAMRYYPSTKSRADTVRWVDRTIAGYQTHGYSLWAAELKETGAFVGQCGLVPQEIEGRPEVEVGYLFVRAYWGRGLATEAAAACCELGFGRFGLSRLVSLIDPANEPSKRVARRIGMGFETQIEKWGKTLDLYSRNKSSPS